MGVLEVEGCRSSVVRAPRLKLVALGSNPQRQLRFFALFLCFFLVFMKGQYKRNVWESWKSGVVIAQWLEQLVAKASGPGFNTWRQLRFCRIFPLLFFRPL